MNGWWAYLAVMVPLAALHGYYLHRDLTRAVFRQRFLAGFAAAAEHVGRALTAMGPAFRQLSAALSRLDTTRRPR